MIILDIDHHDLEVVYQWAYGRWRNPRPSDNYDRLCQQVAQMLQRLKDADYTPAQIEELERAALDSAMPRQRIDAFLDEGE